MNPEDVALPPHRSVSISLESLESAAARPRRPGAVTSGGPAASVENGPLGAEYRKLLRWYPREWRRVNEGAMLGILLDVADGEGRTAPTHEEVTRLMRAGLAQRFGPPRRGERLTLLPLSAGAILSVFYAMFIIWAPDTRYAGSLGPFSNPSIVTCALLVSAFCAALSLRGTAASTLALTAVGAEIAIGILSAVNGWQGPGGSAVVLFAGIGILAGSFRRGSSLVIGCLIVIAATATTVIVGWVTAGLGQFSMVSASASALVILLVLVAAGLSVRRMRRPATREAGVSSHDPLLLRSKR